MKIEVATDAVKSNLQVGDAKAFSFDINGASFRVIFDTLYSDKLGSIAQELTCNAWDSMLAAGTTDQLIEVTLPNALLPEFSIRDFGMGLSDEDMQGLYTTVFRSESRQSMFATGGLGLGSKSPLCYTDNFTVQSFFNGEVRSYQVYLSEDIPHILPISCEPTTEHNGLKVTLAIPERDFDECRKAVDRRLFLFKDKITYKGRFPQFDNFKDGQIFLETDDFIISKAYQSQTYSRTGVAELYAAMGNVLYKIDSTLVMGSDSPIYGIRAILKFKLGEVDFAASREHLSYKPRTIAAIKAKLTLLNESVVEHFDVIKKEVEKSTVLEQIRKCKELAKSQDNISAVYKANKGDFFWNTIISKICNHLATDCKLRFIHYHQRWSRRAHRYVNDVGSMTEFLNQIEPQRFRAVKGVSNIMIGDDYERVMRASHFTVEDNWFAYASEDNWENIESYLGLSFDYNELANRPAKVARAKGGEKFENRKHYDHWVLGSKDSGRLCDYDYDMIFFEKDDNVNAEWMRVFSALVNNVRIPFVHYNGRLQSKLENSFKTTNFNYHTNVSEVLAVKKTVRENMIKMRVWDALYCKRYLNDEIEHIKEELPNSEFVKEISEIEIYPLIHHPETTLSRLKGASLVDSYREDFDDHVPEFLARYPMLRLIRAERRCDNNAKETTTKDHSTLVDYIRFCEGETLEIYHHKLVCDSARRKRKSLAVQNGTGRKKGVKGDLQGGRQSVESDLQEEVCDLHREAVSEEGHSDQIGSVLLQGEIDRQQFDSNVDQPVQEEAADGGVCGILRECDEKPLRKFAQRTVRLLNRNKTPYYKQGNLPRVS